MNTKDSIAQFIKKMVYSTTEKYQFNNKTLLFKTGTRPIKRKYISSENDVVRNDVLQIIYFEKNFTPQDVLWDIGSHNGHYTIFSASVAKGPGQVFSFEPDAAARKIQEENIKYNGLQDHVKIINAAVSDKDGSIQFRFMGGNSVSHIEKFQTGETEGDIITVPTRAIDSLLNELPAPTFVKIDVEGAEIDVLSSAGKLLENHNVKFICELHPFAWDSFKVQYSQFEDIIKKYGRKLELLDPKMKMSDLPYYGTVLF